MSTLIELAPLAATQDDLGLARAAAERLLAILAVMEFSGIDKSPREGFSYQLLAMVARSLWRSGALRRVRTQRAVIGSDLAVISGPPDG